MLTHLFELRRRLLHVVVVFVLLFITAFLFASQLFHGLMFPLLHVLPEAGNLLATQITSPLFTPIKVAADMAMLLTAPYALIQGWCFVAPGLYQRERKWLRWTLVLSVLLFIAGALFCFGLILPFMLQFMVNAVPAGVKWMPDIVYAVDFIVRMVLIFGICFQVPLLLVILVALGVMPYRRLITARPYVIVFAFIIGMILTPPDVLSQVMLAVPLCLLYELGILCARVVSKQA